MPSKDYLIIKQNKSSVFNKEEEKENEVASAKCPKQTPTVMVVDDDRFNIKIISENLKSIKYNVLSALNGK